MRISDERRVTNCRDRDKVVELPSYVRSPARIITLLTDFGVGSPYVAQMKGVILSLNPHALLIDVTHGIGPQDIAAAAWVLRDVAESFPPGRSMWPSSTPASAARGDHLCRDRRASLHRAG